MSFLVRQVGHLVAAQDMRRRRGLGFGRGGVIGLGESGTGWYASGTGTGTAMGCKVTGSRRSM